MPSSCAAEPHRAVLVDTGPDPPLVDGCLSRLGVTTLDAVVLTHFHADHVDGLVGALSGRDVAQVLVGPVREPASAADAVDRLAARHGIPVAVLHAGDRVTVGELDAEVWSPVAAHRRRVGAQQRQRRPGRAHRRG